MVNKIDLNAFISSIASNDQKIIEKSKNLGSIKIETSNSMISEKKIRFLDNSINELFLKRSITKEFSFYSKFTTKSLPGEKLAEFNDSTPALSYHKGEFHGYKRLPS